MWQDDFVFIKLTPSEIISISVLFVSRSIAFFSDTLKLSVKYPIFSWISLSVRFTLENKGVCLVLQQTSRNICQDLLLTSSLHLFIRAVFESVLLVFASNYIPYIWCNYDISERRNKVLLN